MAGRRLPKLAVATISTALALLVAEGSARWILGIFPETYDRLYVRDPLLGWKNRREFEGVVSRLDARSFVAINSRGLRGGDLEYRKAPSIFRILVLGDSFAFGLGVPEEGTFGRVLESALNTEAGRKVGRRIEAINGGVIGYSTVQEFLLLRSEAIKYEPDLVIVLFYLDDVETNLRDRHLLDGLPPRPSDDRDALKVRFAAARRLLRRHSGLYLAIGSAIRAGLPALAGFLKSRGLMATQERPVLAGTFSRRPDSRVEAGWSVTAAVVTKMARLLAERSSRLLVVYVPLGQQLLPKHEALAVLQRSYDGVTLSPRDFDIDAPNTALQRIGSIADVPVVDLTAPFRSQRSSSGPLYFHYDGHWTGSGHRLAATVVGQFLTSNGLLH